MATTRKARSTERPPSPKASPRRPRKRARLVGGAAALVAVGLATAFGPAAADELSADGTEARTPARKEAVAVELSTAPFVVDDRAPQTAGRAEQASTRQAQVDYAESIALAMALHDAQWKAYVEGVAAAQERAAAEEAARQAAAEEAARQQEAAASAPSAPAASGGSGGGGGGGSHWDALAQCESGGDWGISTGNGYYGGLQFSMSTWQAMGGSGNPASASREQQIAVAERVLDAQGWGAWPSCSSQLGLR